MGILLVCACHKVSASVKTAKLEDIYLHCPDSTVVVFKEINDSFGMRLKIKDCDLSVLIEDPNESDYANESPGRVRRIKHRNVELQKLESQ